MVFHFSQHPESVLGGQLHIDSRPRLRPRRSSRRSALRSVRPGGLKGINQGLIAWLLDLQSAIIYRMVLYAYHHFTAELDTAQDLSSWNYLHRETWFSNHLMIACREEYLKRNQERGIGTR